MVVSLITMVILFWVIFFKATRKLSEQSPYKRPPLAQLHRDSAEETKNAEQNQKGPANHQDTKTQS
jgi:hypothetical protein